MSTIDRHESSNPSLRQVEHDLARTRERVASSILSLRGELARRADWHAWVRAKPAVFLAIAFTVGLMLGRRVLQP